MQRAAVASIALGIVAAVLGPSTTIALVGLGAILAGAFLSLCDGLWRGDARVAAVWALALGVVTILAVVSLWYSPAAVVTGPLALFLAWIARRAGVHPRRVRAAFVTAASGLVLFGALVIYLLVAE